MNLALTLNVVGLLLSSNNVLLVPGGDNIAFEIKSNGVIITGTYDINTSNGVYNPSNNQDIRKGDIIKEVEGNNIDSLESFINEFNKYLSKDNIDITLYRKGNKLNKSLKLIKQNDDIKTGLFVKDRLIGIGTVSFYDKENHIYGALGHEVYDDTSSSIVELKTGSIYKSEVIGINNNKKIAEKVADISLETEVGSILINSNYGIFGEIDDMPSSYTPIKLANIEEVSLGKAYIRTVTKGNKIDEYEINITSLKPQDNLDIKGIEFDVIDEDLISLGGIYYGMSGSPIIQNNMLVGAVSHVKSSNRNSGYALYMEHMYNFALDQLK